MTTISDRLLIDVMLVEVAVVVIVAASLLVHAILLRRRARTTATRLAAARPALAAAVAADQEVPPVELTSLPVRLRDRVFLEVTRSVGGGQRRRLADLADQLGLRSRAERRMRSRFWWRRLYGVHVLARVFDADAGLAAVLGDRSPVVRAEAIIWAGDNVDAVLADRLVTLLADPTSLCRLAATDALMRAGNVAVGSIARRLADIDDASLTPLLHIAAARPDPRYESAALAAADHPRPEVRAEGARLLSAIGGDRATALLVDRLDDEAAVVRAAAAAGLGRLDHWPAAPAVARLLRDRSWDVRAAAGEALAGLGAPGQLLLERYASDLDPFAADMATRVTRTAQLRRVGMREEGEVAR